MPFRLLNLFRKIYILIILGHPHLWQAHFLLSISTTAQIYPTVLLF